MKNNTLAINSTLIIISTTILGTILHEISHYVLAEMFGLNAELHHNYVSFQQDKANELQLVLVAGIGPIVSLIFGIIFTTISIFLQKVNLTKLFTLWFGMNGILMFLGYLIIAPFAKQGDTGKVFSYLGIPNLLTGLLAVIVFIIIVRLFSKLSHQFYFYKSSLVFNKKDNVRQLFKMPLIISTAILFCLNFPIISWITLLPVLFLPMSYIGTMKSYQRSNLDNAVYTSDKISLPILVLSFFLIGCFLYLK